MAVIARDWRAPRVLNWRANERDQEDQWRNNSVHPFCKEKNPTAEFTRPRGSDPVQILRMMMRNTQSRLACNDLLGCRPLIVTDALGVLSDHGVVRDTHVCLA